jgi:DNA (cytosine-5)-methyltransferase 1
MPAYYNEIDPYAAQWIRNLIAAEHIAPGDVDERSIVDVQPEDLRGYDQCHFFAGIGGWSYSLRLAGWPDDRPIWTGSCPCQPFSVAGRGLGIEDERHLWPAFFTLISQCRPAIIFGEQIAGPDGYAWLDHVCSDLEGIDYATAAADLPAGAVGMPHKRHRLWWMGSDPYGDRWEGRESSGQLCQAGFRDQEFARLVQGQIQLSLPAGRDRALSDGISNRVGKMRAYGNAIVPQVAAEFISAAVEAMNE